MSFLVDIKTPTGWKTLLSVPLILHNRSKEAIKGGLKYLFYSLFGAYLVLFGIFFLNRFADSLTFLPGGTLNLGAVAGNEKLMLMNEFQDDDQS